MLPYGLCTSHSVCFVLNFTNMIISIKITVKNVQNNIIYTISLKGTKKIQIFFEFVYLLIL